MPLNKKGKKILKSMKEQYGSDAEKVFYSSKNKGTIKNVEKKMGGGLSGGKRSGPPPLSGPNPQGLKVAKAKYGLLFAVPDLFERSQTARDIGSQLGLAPKFLSDKYNKEAQEKKEELEKTEQKKTMGLKEGGMSCPYRRGGKTGIQGVSKIQVKGQKFTGVK
jgi:hypothetical protein